MRFRSACRWAGGSKIPIDAAHTELGRACEVVVAINVALLTELDQKVKSEAGCRS